MRLNINLDKSRLSEEAVASRRDDAIEIIEELYRNNEAFTGWVNLPAEISDNTFNEIEAEAERIRGLCDLLIVVGIGGSYLGTAAVLDALGGSKAGCPRVEFAGTNLNGAYQKKIASLIKDNETCICCVSKSGSTMETLISFSILKDELRKKYGDDISERIVAITDPVKGILRAEADREGYSTFVVPGNVGGRYSAFTAGIMFPLAVAGVDIRSFVQGAAEIANPEFWRSEGAQYALARFAGMKRGKDVEIIEFYDPTLRLVGEWIKQLFGESEGKEGRGLLPVSLILSTDLHSMGQYLQDGKQFFFETVYNVMSYDDDVVVPESAGPMLAGKSLNEINQAAVNGVMLAHSKADIPIIQINIDRIDEYSLGQLMYYLMITSAVTGKLMKVDPFNQEGVEDYKREMRALLGM